ncbi:hypothetical protein DPMN_064449, partial [Dreissena polymorpha]
MFKTNKLFKGIKRCSTDEMSMFTCIACRVVFAESSTQRAHYKTDWHRYNLKRKVADLPPVSADNFKQKVLTVQQSQGDGDTKQSQGCTACGKHFSSQNALQNHLNSKKHKEIEAQRNTTKEKEENKQKSKQPITTENKVVTGATSAAKEDEDMEVIETDSDMESVSSFGDEEGLPLGTCLFCSHDDGALEDSLRHMTQAHSFFLPDAEYISDLEGLITYLGQKVGAGFVCLWCNQRGRSFRSVGAVQKHMLDKGHCKILHDGDVVLEYADFYDYRSSYPDHNESAGEAVEGQTEEMEVEVTPETLDADGYELVLPS